MEKAQWDSGLHTVVRYRYSWNGCEYVGEQIWPTADYAGDLEAFAQARSELQGRANPAPLQGSILECLVNPTDPEQAALLAIAPGAGTNWMLVISGAFFATTGWIFLLRSVRAEARK